MGLFDIFKKTETQKEAAEPVAEAAGTDAAEETVTVDNQGETTASEPEGYTGDLEKTQILASLVQVPLEERTEMWVHEFLLNLPQASLKCGTPQLIAGPDGFPYFQLFIPSHGEEFQCFIVERMIPDFLVERGYGVVINPGSGQPDWVLT